MSLPDERYRSIQNTREFLLSLLDSSKTPRVPKSVRMNAYHCLKHFPSDLDLDRASEYYDSVFQYPENYQLKFVKEQTANRKKSGKKRTYRLAHTKR